MEKRKGFFAVLLAVLMVVVLIPAQAIVVYADSGTQSAVWSGKSASGFQSGDGSKNSPYIIKTPEQLKYFANQVNAGTSFSGKCIKLGADISMNTTDMFDSWSRTAPQNVWTAVGTYSHPFSGTFDGDGHAINGLYISSSDDSQGLFGFVQNATISNLNIKNSYVSGGSNTGGIVGFLYAYNGTSQVTECSYSGTVIGDSYVGGITGWNYSENMSSTVRIRNCYHNGTVSGLIGVGGVSGASEANGTVEVSCCYHVGSVTGNHKIGGVVGENTGKVSNCYYLTGCATDGNRTVQYGIGGQTPGSTANDISGMTRGLSDAQMKQKSNFSGFDFTAVWTMSTDSAYSYPILKKEPTVSYYSVTYHANGGSGNIPTNSSTYMSGSTVPVLFSPVPTRSGYSFLGWARSSGAGSPEFTSSGVKTFTITNDTTFYAVWQKTSSGETGGTEKTEITETGAYTIFSSGRSGFGYSYSLFSNPAPRTLTNGGYDIYADADTSSIRTVPLGRSFVVSKKVTEQATLTIYAFDVDEAQGERDLIYLVDETTGNSRQLSGYLSGMDQQWNTTTFKIDPSWFTVGHTYSFKLTESVSGWVVYIRTVSINLPIENSISSSPIVSSDFSASIDAAGHVSTKLTLATVTGASYHLEYAATNVGVQYGSAFSEMTVSSAGTVKTVDFSLISAPKGTYQIDVIIKKADGSVVDTLSTTAGYISYSVNYNANGGSQNLPNDTKAYSSGDTVTVLFTYVPSRPGDKFLGWSRSAKATSPEFTSSGTNSFSINADTTLYAVWKSSQPTQPGIKPTVWNGKAATGFASGSGTENDPYIIMTAEQLKFFADAVNSGNSFKGKYIKLGADIALNDTVGWQNWGNSFPANTWTPIGNDPDPFSGTFDGGNHTVSGIYIDNRSYYYVGLFGCAVNATICNVGVECSYVRGYSYVGGVLGQLKASGGTATIFDCFCIGTVIGNQKVGGVVGSSETYGTQKGTVTVRRCFHIGEVTATGTSSSASAGGVVGYNCASDSASVATVYDCYHSGTVTGYYTYAGGVVGENVAGYRASQAMVINCYNAGNVTAACAGGVIGGNFIGDSNCLAKASNCYYQAGCVLNYYEIEQYGVSGLADESGATTGLTDARMKQAASFIGFDFDTVWTIDAVEDYGYPTLLWEKNVVSISHVISEEPAETEESKESESTTETESTESSDKPSDQKKGNTSRLVESVLIGGAAVFVVVVALVVVFFGIVKKQTKEDGTDN